MLKLTDDVMNWLLDRLPDAPVSPQGGRPGVGTCASHENLHKTLLPLMTKTSRAQSH